VEEKKKKRRRRRSRRQFRTIISLVEDGLYGLLIESPELDLGNRVASKVSHKLLFFSAGSKSLALWGFPNPDVWWAVEVEVGTHPRGTEPETSGREALGMKKTRGAKGKTSGPQMRWLGEWPGSFSRFTLHASRIHASTLHGHLAEHVSRLATTRCTRALVNRRVLR
jgi:hypothetical protein